MEDAHADGWADSVSIIPVESRGKKPLVPWTEFQRRCATREERNEWRKRFPGSNWGLVTGKISSTVALDFDGEEGLALRKEKNVFGPIPTNLTGKGCHCLFRYPEREIRNGVRLLPGLDVRGDGGYIIIPPSTHPSGKKYEWQVPPWQVPELPELPEWVWGLVEKPRNGPASSTGVVECDGLPPGVSEGRRNATAASLAGRYLAKGLTAEETVAILLAWNRKSHPPLPEIEIRRVVFSIARKEREKTPVIDLIDSSELATLSPQAEKKIIDPFLNAGSKNILAGWQGSYKSTLVLNFAVAIRNGLPVFGRYDAIKGSVLYVDRENSPALTSYRVEKIARGMNGLRGGITFQFPAKKPDLANPRVREEYIRIIDHEKFDLVVFDSFLAFFNLRNENDNTEVRNVLELVGEIPAKSGAAILFIDHAAKNSPDKERAKIKVTPRGASAKGDWADVVMTIEERDDEARKLRTLRFPKTRFSMPLPAIVLEVGPNLVFNPSGVDEICPVFTVRQVVADTPGIGATRLFEELVAKTGCSKRTAIYSTKKTEDLGYIFAKSRGRSKEYFPKQTAGISMQDDLFTKPETTEDAAKYSVEH